MIRKSSQKNLIFAAIFVCIFLIIGYRWYLNEKKQTTSSHQTTIWKTFTNERYQYSITYPPYMYTDHSSATGLSNVTFDLTQSSKNTPLKRVSIASNINDSFYYKTLDEFLDYSFCSNPTDCPKNTATDVKIAGEQGKKMQTSRHTDKNIIEDVYVFKKGKYFHTIYVEKNNIPQYHAELSKMLSSMKFSPQNQSEQAISTLTKQKYNYYLRYPEEYRIEFENLNTDTGPNNLFDIYEKNNPSLKPTAALRILITKPEKTIEDWTNKWEHNASGQSLLNEYTIEKIQIGNKQGYHLIPKDPDLSIGAGTTIKPIYVVLTNNHAYKIEYLYDTNDTLILQYFVFE